MIDQAQKRFQAENPVERVGVWVLLVAQLTIFSRLHDYVPYLHLPALLLTMCLLISLATNGWLRALQSPIGKCLTILTIWFGVACIFSIWRGGSVALYTGTWLKSYAIFIVVSGLLIKISDVSMAVWMSALGVSITGLSALLFGKLQDGRNSTNVGRFGDVNDLAQILIVGICLSAAIYSRKETGFIRRGVIVVIALVMCVAMAKTGSRGGFIGVMVVVAVLFLQSSASGKLVTAVVCATIAFASVTLLPSTLLNRYLALLGNSAAEEDLSDGAIGSAQSRKHLLLRSLYVTRQNPLFGVGPGMFQEEEDTIAKDEGFLHGAWHETHNMYTQVSSEAGLPALFCFLGMYIYGFRNLNAVCRAGRQSRDPAILDAAALAFWMRLALVGLTTTGLFLSVAYSPEPLVLLGICVALERAVRIRMEALSAAPMPIPVTPAIASRGKERLPRFTGWKPTRGRAPATGHALDPTRSASLPHARSSSAARPVLDPRGAASRRQP